MLNPSEIRNSFDKIVHNIKKKYIVITLSSLMAFSSIVPNNANAIERETLVNFRDLSKQAQVLVNSGNISEKDRKDMDKKFKSFIKGLEKEVEKDIKNQEWDKTKYMLSLMREIVEPYDREISGKLDELKTKVHNDFVSRIDFSRPGVYTLKGSGMVYIISYGKSKFEGLARREAESDATTFLVMYLNGNNRVFNGAVRGGPQPLSYKITEGKNEYQVCALLLFPSSGSVVLSDKTVLTGND